MVRKPSEVEASQAVQPEGPLLIHLMAPFRRAPWSLRAWAGLIVLATILVALEKGVSKTGWTFSGLLYVGVLSASGVGACGGCS